MEPLGCFWESFWNLSGTFGRLLENVSKTIQKVIKVHQKSPKGGPKAPKGSPKATKKAPFFDLFETQRIFLKGLKMELKLGTLNVSKV